MYENNHCSSYKSHTKNHNILPFKKKLDLIQNNIFKKVLHKISIIYLIMVFVYSFFIYIKLKHEIQLEFYNFIIYKYAILRHLRVCNVYETLIIHNYSLIIMLF